MTHYRQALTIQSNLANARYMLGVVLEECQRLQEAMACYYKAIALAPELTEAHVALGRLLEQQDRHKKL